MAVGRRARGRRKNRRRSRQQEAIDTAYESESARQAELLREEQQREVWQTTEGEGVMEGATISLGFDEEEEDDIFRSATGLVI